MQPHRHDAEESGHDHDQGLAHDLGVLQQRRRALGLLAGIAGLGGLTLLGCGGGGADAGTSTTGTGSGTGTGTGTGTGSTGSTGSCSVIPEETAGPYPGDGSNSNGSGIANVLALSGIVRSDIRTSIGTASGTAGGVPLTLTLKLVNANSSCADLSGYAIYLWHCDREGRYSLYSASVVNENYLRGVQSTGSDGTVTFTTIFPGCYDGRMPHMHFEVYRNAGAATSYANKIKTSQIAFPTAVCTTVYSTASGYSSSLTNFNRISFASDNVFSDGYSTQLATLTGDVTSGYAATLTVGISA
ncbi:intradiol ring-cleavage dioxygenase [Roseateles chitinivorans]|uniref:intradiol ring-cleavage dioxygenase n=1 Tax=Roseateles chitinivorans TaxID=2917965 RepID=UPI003D67957D